MNQNQNLHERVNVGLQGFRAALELLAESLQMIADGVNHLEAEPLHGANIDINQPVTLAAIRACMGSIEQSGIRIRGAVDDINFFIPTQPDVRPNFPAQIRVITVAMRMMGSSALAIHGFLVHNSFGRRETLGGVYYRIQLGLAHLNMALLEFQTNISILRSLEPQGYYIFLLSIFYFFHSFPFQRSSSRFT